MTESLAPLNLSPVSVKIRWQKAGVNNIIRSMENKEHWTIDGVDSAEMVLSDFADRVSGITKEILAAAISTKSELFIEFVGHLKTGRALTVMRWLSDENPLYASKILSESRESGNEFSLLLLERITVFERIHLLSRVFAPERISAILDLLEDLSNEN